MGYRCDFICEEIEVLDFDNLKKVIDILRKNGIEDIATGLDLDEKDKTLSFEGWSDYKLIGYWYDDTILTLELISPFIEGYVEFKGEDGEQKCRIMFKDGNCKIELGEMIFYTNPPLEINNIDFKKQPKEIQEIYKSNKLYKTATRI